MFALIVGVPIILLGCAYLFNPHSNKAFLIYLGVGVLAAYNAITQNYFFAVLDVMLCYIWYKIYKKDLEEEELFADIWGQDEPR